MLEKGRGVLPASWAAATTGIGENLGKGRGFSILNKHVRHRGLPKREKHGRTKEERHGQG